MSHPTFDPNQETTRIVAFIQSIFSKTGKTKAVIALSGGIDSTVSFLLTLRALGKENLLPLHLPSKTSHRQHTKDVETLLASADFPIESLTTIPIGSMIQKTWHIVNRNSTIENRNSPSGTPDRKAHNAEVAKHNHLRLANISARLRMVAIFDHAKRHDALVVGTENYSEHLLGYFTRFGDEASDLEPIRHLYKTEVITLAKHLGAPAGIISKPPSADLWPGQSDESEMGFSYAQADPILYLHDQGKSPEEIAIEGHNLSLVKKVLFHVVKNKFKHEVPYGT